MGNNNLGNNDTMAFSNEGIPQEAHVGPQMRAKSAAGWHSPCFARRASG
jgi:hypothetical protein